MNAILPPLAGPARVRHVVKGQVVEGDGLEYGREPNRFTTPPLDVGALVWPRPAPTPAADVPIDEIIDVLVATGDVLKRDASGALAQAMERSVAAGFYPRDLVETSFAHLGHMFSRASMEFMIDQEIGGKDLLDGWREVATPSGRPARVRAFPCRLLHVIAGNSPGVAANTVIRGALTKGAHLLKLPSNELFSAPAILAALSEAAPGHPVARSFSAAYWRGGDEAVESLLFRPQYFDKIVAWGGESTIKGALKYVGPGLELVAFDPKTSISLIGREVFASEATLEAAAEAGAHDATIMNQEACTASRFQFIEGSIEQIDRYCEGLQAKLGQARRSASGEPRPITRSLRDEIDGLRDLEDYYRVWGGYEGRGLVIRSDEAVDFYPEGKVVNVVAVERLEDALRHVNVATQTVGVYPPQRKVALRDLLASAGAQRIVSLGCATPEVGLPHDGFYPLHRFVRWVNDEG
ncbi:acyl-CoA reductase [Caulobacter sp. BK020]|uniref:acyl-CoA reductase n=1 Tax=Caulobacter sp. BK020 TaxID=2512117 RepID=UPI00104C7D36|nr:acyl-CoA reductase [Caulobacter sp. BK020]TCS02041.1 acyl-CoA reductase LuxC [Caulobacter sp. BK020]